MIFSISSYLLILLLFDQSYFRTDMLSFYFFKVFWALSYLPTSIDTERYFFRIWRNSYSQATFLSLFTKNFKNLKKYTFHSQIKAFIFESIYETFFSKMNSLFFIALDTTYHNIPMHICTHFWAESASFKRHHSTIELQINSQKRWIISGRHCSSRVSLASSLTL